MRDFSYKNLFGLYRRSAEAEAEAAASRWQGGAAAAPPRAGQGDASVLARSAQGYIHT